MNAPDPSQSPPDRAMPGFDAGRPERPPRDAKAVEAARAFAIQVAVLADQLRCEHVMILDVTSVSEMTDFVIVASGSSDRQMRSVLDEVEELGEQALLPTPRRNTDDRSLWLLADFVDVVVHLFEPNTRAHYDIESMWGEVPMVEWRDHRPKRPPAGSSEGKQSDTSSDGV